MIPISTDENQSTDDETRRRFLMIGRRKGAIAALSTVSYRLKSAGSLKRYVGSGESKIVAEARSHQTCTNALQAASSLLKVRLTEDFNATC